LGLVMKVKTERTANQEILDNLVGGCSYLRVVSDSDLDYPNLLKDVHLSMITSDWHIQDPERLNAYVASDTEEKDINLNIRSGSKDISFIQLTQTAEMYERFLDQADRYLNEHAKGDFTCSLEFTHDYTQSITQVLAIRLLWANLCEAYSINGRDLIIEGRISEEVRSAEIHQDLIAITQMMAAMFSSDVDIICPMGSDDNQENQRLIRQAFHVLTMEGHLGKVKAPYSGSYALETIALQTAQNAWEKYVG